MRKTVFSQNSKKYLRFKIEIAYLASVLCFFVSGTVFGSIKSDLGGFWFLFFSLCILFLISNRKYFFEFWEKPFSPYKSLYFYSSVIWYSTDTYISSLGYLCFHLNFESIPRLLWFCSTSLCNWLDKTLFCYWSSRIFYFHRRAIVTVIMLSLLNLLQLWQQAMPRTKHCSFST